MITLKDLAKELHLSVSAVSKALSDSYEISEETKIKVRALAKEKNYKRNKAAVSLRKNKTKTIGVIIPNILNPFFARLLHNVEKEASNYDYNIITCISNESLEKEKKSIELLTDGSVDGIIITVSKETQKLKEVKHLEQVIHNNIPMVMSDRFIEEIQCDKVISDDYEVVYKATNYLLREGRKQIVLLNSLSELNVGKNRVSGYKRALKDSVVSKQKPIIFDIANNEEVDVNLMNFLEKNKKVDAIIAIDNTIGPVALNVLKSKGKKIPKEVSVIGFSSKHIVIYTNPKLTTIAQQSRKMAKQALIALTNRIENNCNDPLKTITISSKLEHRETTKQK